MFVRESNTNVHVVTTSPYNLANHVNAYDHAVVENNHPIIVEGLQHIGQLGAWHFVALH